MMLSKLDDGARTSSHEQYFARYNAFFGTTEHMWRLLFAKLWGKNQLASNDKMYLD